MIAQFSSFANQTFLGMGILSVLYRGFMTWVGLVYLQTLKPYPENHIMMVLWKISSSGQAA